ncbi:MAG TPA: tripartite tricarboxylate transporter TctB family protein, partial [Vicinamibacterales bacterium]
SRLADAIGPQGLPKTYALLLAALSLVLIARSLARRREARPLDNAAGARTAPRVLRRIAGMLTIGIVYILVAPWLGYPLSIAGLILATTYYQGGEINRQVALVAVTGALFFWALFVLIMGIPQPPGWWPALL